MQPGPDRSANGPSTPLNRSHHPSGTAGAPVQQPPPHDLMPSAAHPPPQPVQSDALIPQVTSHPPQQAQIPTPTPHGHGYEELQHAILLQQQMQEEFARSGYTRLPTVPSSRQLPPVPGPGHSDLPHPSMAHAPRLPPGNDHSQPYPHRNLPPLPAPSTIGTFQQAMDFASLAARHQFLESQRASQLHASQARTPSQSLQGDPAIRRASATSTSSHGTGWSPGMATAHPNVTRDAPGRTTSSSSLASHAGSHASFASARAPAPPMTGSETPLAPPQYAESLRRSSTTSATSNASYQSARAGSTASTASTTSTATPRGNNTNKNKKKRVAGDEPTSDPYQHSRLNSQNPVVQPHRIPDDVGKCIALFETSH